MQPVNLFEYEALAKTRLTKAIYDHIAGGATDEITLRRTRAVYDSIMLRPRMLADVDKVQLETTALGAHISYPVMIAPAGDHGRAHPDGELATARATGAAGTLMCVSAGAAYTLEQVAKAATGPLWFQQYFYKDPGITLEFAKRAEAAGYRALCITLDSQVPAKRERNLRNGYKAVPGPNYRTDEEKDVDRKATWAQMDWLGGKTRLPLIAKGIMTQEDARLCVEHGAKAVAVSNHGARQLDTTFAAIEALPEVAAAIGTRAEVYVDGGIRRGTDIVKAIALGARAVFVGRPVFWGLAVNGEAGARAVLEMLRDELATAMAMCGRPTIGSIDRSAVGMVSPLLSLFPTSPETGLPNR